ncbi:MAG: tail fiber domain-containing protein [Planctomycetota bacterium]
MKRTSRVLAFLIMLCLAGVARPCLAQTSSSITYQGALAAAGTALDGTADLRFRLYAGATGGTQLGQELAASGMTVTKGLFTVSLDFGQAFNAGQPRWLEIDVRSPAGSGSFTTLAPRQHLSAAPLAQGIVGIPITFSPVLDQDQAGTFNDGFIVENYQPCWQSFTAGKSGVLDRMEVYQAAFYGALTATLHSGLGLSGPILETVVVANPADVTAIHFSSVTVNAGSIYTIEFRGYVGLMTVSASIPGAVGHADTNTVNWWFRTYVDSSAHIDATVTTAASVAWSGVTGVPANVSGAFSPWSPSGAGIGYNGDVGIGSTPPQSRLHVSGGNIQLDTNQNLQFGGSSENGDLLSLYRWNYAGGQSVLSLNLGNPANGNDAFLIQSSSGTTLFQFNTQSGGQALKSGGGSWGVLSDARAKHDIKPLDGSLDRLLKLKGRSYYYNDPTALGAGEGLRTGFVAQEAEQVFPEWIAESGGLKTINVTGFEALTVEALRDLRSETDKQIDQLKAENAELKARLDRLEAAMLKAAK